MRKRLFLALTASISVLTAPSPAASAGTATITVDATVSSPNRVVARIEVCHEERSTRCYRVLRIVEQGEIATFDSFLSLEISPLPSLLGELSVSADGQSLDYRLEFVSGALPIASATGSVSLAGE
jgi:hypothetical protein